ncbi:MAG: MCP four helix bundle domain-containing protein, partial [Pseudomonas sp.]
MLRAFADLGFRWKIALPILLLAALLVAMGTLGVRGITQVAESSTTLTNRHLPAISLLLNADRDLYQAFVAERSLLDEDSGAYAAQLRASHAENLQQAYDRVHKFAAMQPGSEALALVAEFDRGFERWKATSLRVLELASSDPNGASRLSFADSEAQFEEARTAIDKLGELEDSAANAVGTAAIARGEALLWQQGLII